MNDQLSQLRTWIEIDAKAAKTNYDTFRKLAGKKVKLWSVVKSNAYGHGLYAFTKLLNEFGVDGFCVDSVVEALSLRKVGIKKQILVLGQTLPSRFAEAAKHNITISISSFEGLRALAKAKNPPDFHLKIDTGMHRQGFYNEDIPAVVALLKKGKPEVKNSLKGIFTHFAAAKDMKNQAYTGGQLKKFKKAVALFEEAGFKKLVAHASATGGAMLGPQYHFDAVRVGIGLYGLWPSEELERQLGRKIILHPVLQWRTIASEVKKIKKGEYVGYDITERVAKNTTMAVLPIGYWHGFPRALSSTGEVIVNGKRGRVLGRVSMDMVVVEVPEKTKAGSVVTIIGRDGKEKIHASEPAKRSGTSHYEFVTRLNPLMERVIIR
jgi:alanine racemase